MTKLLTKLFALGLCALLLATACGGNAAATPEPEKPPLTPVIFIPGITGSQLMALDAHILWPPGGPGCYRSLNTEPVKEDFQKLSLNPAIPHQALVATDVIRDDGPGYPVYSPLLYALSSAGYVEYKVNNDPRLRTTAGCDLNQRKSKPTLFVFAYDWRLDNEETAAKLADYVGCIQRFYPKTKVNIVTHRMGGIIARRYIIDNPGAVNKLITVAAPFLGSPKPLYQMIQGLLGVGMVNNLAWLRYGDEVQDMLAYYPSLHQLMSSRMYFALGGVPFRDLGTDGVLKDTAYPDLMGPGGVVDGLFMKASSNGKTPAQSNRDFHSYTKDGNNQDDWSTDTTKVKYFHLVGVQQSGDTPLTVVDRHASTFPPSAVNTMIKQDSYLARLFQLAVDGPNPDYVVGAAGPGDGTVPRLSAERIGADGRNLNAPGARVFVYSSGNDGLLEHTGLMQNPTVVAQVIRLLRSDMEEEATATPIPKPAPTRTPTPTPTPTAVPAKPPTATPAVTATMTFEGRDYHYVLKRVELNCGSAAAAAGPTCKDLGTEYYQRAAQKPSLELAQDRATYVRVGNAKPDVREPDTTRVVTWAAPPQEIRPGQTYNIATKGSLVTTAPGSGPLQGKMPYGAMNGWLRAIWMGTSGTPPADVTPQTYTRVGNDTDTPVIKDGDYAFKLDPARFRADLEKNGLKAYSRYELVLVVDVGAYTGDSGANSKTSYGAPFRGTVLFVYDLAYLGPPP